MGVAARLTAYALRARPRVRPGLVRRAGSSGPRPRAAGGRDTGGDHDVHGTDGLDAEAPPTGSPPPPRATGSPSPTPLSRRAPPASCGSPCSARTARPVTAFTHHPARPEPAARRGRAPRRRGLPAPRPDHGPRRHLAHPAAAARAGRVARLRRHDPHGGARARARRRPVRRGPVRPVHLPAVAHRRRSAASSSASTATWCRARRRRSSPRSAATARASPTCSPTSARSASSSRSARAISPTPRRRRRAPAVGDRAGPAVAFTARVPSAGTYRLFLQFRVADVMHTAEFTVPTRNP